MTADYIDPSVRSKASIGLTSLAAPNRSSDPRTAKRFSLSQGSIADESVTSHSTDDSAFSIKMTEKHGIPTPSTPENLGVKKSKIKKVKRRRC